MLPDKQSINYYGGALRNYSDPVDSETDEHAKYRNRYVADVAALGRTAPRAMVSFVGANGANPTDPASGFIHDSMWGVAPADKPVWTRAGEGIYDGEWPTTVNDALSTEPEAKGGGETHELNFQRALAQVESADGTFKAAHAKVTGPNTVRVYCYDGTTLDDLDGLVCTVWVW